eukprot:6469456-Amphidinium_carterae.3
MSTRTKRRPEKNSTMVHEEKREYNVSNQWRQSSTNYTTSNPSWRLHGDEDDFQGYTTMDYHGQDGLQDEALPRLQHHRYR